MGIRIHPGTGQRRGASDGLSGAARLARLNAPIENTALNERCVERLS
ncbi:hypothetical protein XHV734_4798 [Xanthomonas hortorum pv. vitians]|nr:hypothetical protein XHV734_4798 [Xanthomonas hortorum pv. vitians]